MPLTQKEMQQAADAMAVLGPLARKIEAEGKEEDAKLVKRYMAFHKQARAYRDRNQDPNVPVVYAGGT